MTKTEFEKRYADVLDAAGWGVCVNDGFVDINTDNSLQEDVRYTICLEDLDWLSRYLDELADDIDVDEYVTMRMQAKSEGVSDVPGPEGLVRAAHENIEALEKLADACRLAEGLEKQPENEIIVWQRRNFPQVTFVELGDRLGWTREYTDYPYGVVPKYVLPRVLYAPFMVTMEDDVAEWFYDERAEGQRDPESLVQIQRAGFRIYHVDDEGFLIGLNDPPRSDDELVDAFLPLYEACGAYGGGGKRKACRLP